MGGMAHRALTLSPRLDPAPVVICTLARRSSVCPWTDSQEPGRRCGRTSHLAGTHCGVEQRRVLRRHTGTVHSTAQQTGITNYAYRGSTPRSSRKQTTGHLKNGIHGIRDSQIQQQITVSDNSYKETARSHGESVDQGSDTHIVRMKDQSLNSTDDNFTQGYTGIRDDKLHELS